GSSRFAYPIPGILSALKNRKSGAEHLGMFARLTDHVVRVSLVLLILLACLYTAQMTVGVPIEVLGAFLDRWASMLARIVAALGIAVYARAAGRSSTGWLLIAVGQACWAFGDSYFAIALWDADPMPFPSLAD